MDNYSDDKRDFQSGFLIILLYFRNKWYHSKFNCLNFYIDIIRSDYESNRLARFKDLPEK